MACNSDAWTKVKETRKRLEKCWKTDLDWTLYPNPLKEGCHQVGKALNVPASAVLAGYIVLGSFVLSPATIEIPETDWAEPVLIWITVSMPTGSGKSTLFRHLHSVLQGVKAITGVTDSEPTWCIDDATFEKMGALMHANSSRLIGLYDELSAFLTQINLFRGRNLSDSHELAMFLQLFNGHPWRRDTVSGEANFVMSETRLTVGGFTQPAVARSLIDLPSNTEKGLSHRFLWIFPKPVFGKFTSLESVDKTFANNLATLLARQWRHAQVDTEVSPRIFRLSSKSSTFSDFYDKVQDDLKSISGMDELLAAMLSKGRGIVLRLAVVLQTLFQVGCDDTTQSSGDADDTVSDEAVKAAIDFVEVATQQVAFIAGRGELADELKRFLSVDDDQDNCEDHMTASYCLTLPGKVLYLTPLLSAKKFRNRGNKDGAVRAFMKLEEDGLGKTYVIGGSKGVSQQYEFVKTTIPEGATEKVEFIKTLKKYGVSIHQYSSGLQQKEIKPASPVSRKRASINELVGGSPPKRTQGVMSPSSASCAQQGTADNLSPSSHPLRRSPRKGFPQSPKQ